MKFGPLILLIALLVGLFACLENTTKETAQKSKTERITIQAENTDRNSVAVIDTKKESYIGSWFKIDYPANFEASPLFPKMSEDNYRYIETDEATFTSSDNSVSFFVYSPQWSGEPKDYLMCSSNEKQSSERIQKDPKDEEKITTWLTFEAKDGSYSRSVISKRTMSTHLVFGIRYKDTETLKKYQSDFEAFKKSLVQYAD